MKEKMFKNEVYKLTLEQISENIKEALSKIVLPENPTVKRSTNSLLWALRIKCCENTAPDGARTSYPQVYEPEFV